MQRTLRVRGKASSSTSAVDTTILKAEAGGYTDWIARFRNGKLGSSERRLNSSVAFSVKKRLGSK